jgi:hypothetical protein
MQTLWLALRWDIPVALFLFISPVTFAWGLSTMKNRSMLINAALALKKRGASLA